MHIGIIGAGAGGIFTAIKIKEMNPSYSITIIEKSDKVGKKLCATGNGRCNLANNVIHNDSYNVDVSRIINEESIQVLKQSFFSWGLPIKSIENLCYPYSESANDLVRSLKEILDKLKIEVILNETVKEYEIDGKIKVKTTLNEYSFDKLIISTGGKSSPQLGSNGAIFDILSNHGYEISPLKPGLCPFVSVQNTSKLNGLRIKANVTLYEDDLKISEEEGTVLFKKDGLSGIVIFNMVSRIARRSGTHKYKVSLDLFKEYSLTQLIDLFSQLNNSKLTSNLLEGLFPLAIAKNIIERASTLDISILAKTCKQYEFNYVKSYGFSDSQVTVGGVDLNQLSSYFESKKEKNVYLIGEVIDVDGLSGGYNIMWAFLSGLEAAKAICDIK